MGKLLMVTTCVLFARVASAQILNFTTRPVVDEALLQDRPDTVHLPAGSAVWGIINVASQGFDSVNAFAALPQGQRGDPGIRVTVEMANGSGGWNMVRTGIVPISPEQGATTVGFVPIIPDAPDGSQPFNQLLDMIAAHKGTSPILMRVKIEGGESRFFTQNGFYLDVDHGLGRYGEWLKQRGGAAKAASADFEKQHLRPRSAFVKGYRSLRSDPKFVADVHRWWSAHGGGSPLQSTKVCSDQYIIMHNDLGIVTEKQLCALVTYKTGNQCFAMMRRFSYRRIGKDTFENEVVDATYANQQLAADAGESFSGAHAYEIECSAAR